MDEICMMFAPNMWRSVHTKHAMPYVYQILYQICAQSPPPGYPGFYTVDFC